MVYRQQKIVLSYLAVASEGVVAEINGQYVGKLVVDVMGEVSDSIIGHVDESIVGHVLGGAQLPRGQFIVTEIEEAESGQMGDQLRLEVVHLIATEVHHLQLLQMAEGTARGTRACNIQRTLIEEERMDAV